MTASTLPRPFRVNACPGALTEPSDCYVPPLDFEAPDVHHGPNCLLGPLPEPRKDQP